MSSTQVSKRGIVGLVRLAGGALLVTGALVPGVAGVAEAQPLHQTTTCSSTSPSDFNGDGFIDVAVADPEASVGGAAQAGAVHIRYGVAGKIGGGADTTLTQADTGETVE